MQVHQARVVPPHGEFLGGALETATATATATGHQLCMIRQGVIHFLFILKT